ncbi:hypothetical protein PAE9249_00391 [Paenibacillus sp. CECT 9249]|uniref:GH36-type glycosyl hydrolase domain-containing protein n=1 Tax=Paenibacillus sp. CECT 9249 TaxID=2845385 RepID=UPI001E2B2FAA|nr:cellobiose phosphorylase [Paenibacillus sp. CECT 9249]CAH0117926.1 hypothetical protein PAE9249_00391 [Paenibacillus sp. CECT 9249]
MQREKAKNKGWKFIGESGDFTLERPEETSYLYFPLANEAGMLSAITPVLHGDIKSGHNTFFMPPVSVEDLHNSRASRNFWVYMEGKGAWSAAGNSAKQTASRFGGEEEASVMEAGFLWHKVVRENRSFGLKAEIVSFVPAEAEQAELMQVTITNIGDRAATITPTAAVPVYGRSADDLRDHRHVTSLLHRIYVSKHGIEVQPTLSFDERGHRANRTAYGVFGAEGEGNAPSGFFPVLEEYIGEGGALDWPEAVVTNAPPQERAGSEREGYEAVGAIRFAAAELQPGESKRYTIAMVIADGRIETERLACEYLSASRFDELLAQTKRHWQRKVGAVSFHSGDRQHDLWMKWVTLQPILRRLYGCSFLPHHDYGRGGRGWRDLWQDCLALLIMEPAEVRHLLFNNFAGVRIDGSNATIIGANPGEFVADRNNIPRVWMDHGAWPLVTTLFYLHQSGDLEFLLQEQSFFQDIYVRRCKEKDPALGADGENKLRTEDGAVYRGTILEHLLVQNVVPFFHVGEHNNMKLEGADWNDGLDLAPDKGESVAFTALYASNLSELAKLLRKMKERMDVMQVELAEEIGMLLDTISGSADYGSVSAKRELLERYYDACPGKVKGRKTAFDIGRVAEDLEQKANWLKEHIRRNEWIRSGEGYEWFNGYYDNDGARVEGDRGNGVRMTLTGQVFAVMGGTASAEQVRKVTASVDRYLKDPEIGYRLNTRFGGIQQNLGRAFGFAFGHKENGAMFSHMTVMYANALYKRGFVREGYAVLDSIYRLSADFERSRIYPGIPEYINEKGRGMYHYLTGSASWLLLTAVTEVYGVKGALGDLTLEPKLVREQFDKNGEAAIDTLFAGKKLRIVYRNPRGLDYGEYRIGSVSHSNARFPAETGGPSCVIDRGLISGLPDEGTHTIEVMLS